MDEKQKQVLKKCFNAITALEEERKGINEDIREEIAQASRETGLDPKVIRLGLSLYKKGLSLEDVQELYAIFEEVNKEFDFEE